MKRIANIAAGAVILLLLAGIFIPAGGCGPSKESGITRQEMSRAGTALLDYNQEYGQFPTETDNVLLVQILEGDNPRKLHFYRADRERSKTGQFLDGWDMPLVFKFNDAGLLIRSAGKDGIYHSQDDFTQEVQVSPQSATVAGE